MSVLTSEELELLLRRFAACHSDTLDEFTDGGCDAFAIALDRFLKRHRIESTLCRVTRTTTGDNLDPDLEDNVIDENDMSHVVVGAFDTTWDIYGSGAFETWQDEWVDEQYETSEFGEEPSSVEEIKSIRQRKNETYANEGEKLWFWQLDMLYDPQCPACGELRAADAVCLNKRCQIYGGDETKDSALSAT